MAVVSHPALSAEWSFPSSINPYDAPAFGPHIELAEHTAVHQHQLQVANKRRAHEIEWDDEDSIERLESSLKKSKKSMSRTVDPHQLHGENLAQGAPPAGPSPHIGQVISILVDALTSSGSTPPMMSLGCLPEAPITVLSSTVPSSFPIPRTIPTSPLSNCPNRAPFVRKSIGGSCAGKSEASLCRWVLCKNHFLRVRCLDPTTQSSEWVQTLRDIGWEALHPIFHTEVTPSQSSQTFGALSAFSRWIEDEFEYDGTEDADCEWSDDEDDDDIEMHNDDVPEDAGRIVWDSGVVLQLPGKSLS